MTKSRAATVELLDGLPQRELLRPRTQGQWSIKDVLAHIVAWEAEAVRRLDLIARGRGDRLVFYDDMREVDRFNARAVRASRRLSVTALLQRMDGIRERLVDRLRQLPPVSLQDPTHRYPVTAWLSEFAWTHERQHLARIRAWWKAQTSSVERTGPPV